MKKIYFIFILVGLLFSSNVFAQSAATTIVPTINPQNTLLKPCDDKESSTCYNLIEPLPQSDGTFLDNVDTAPNAGEGKGLGGFITFIIQIGTGIAGVLGVVMLTVYGFQYAANDQNIANFEVLKEKITSVVLGLLLLLGIFIILNTINPDLLIVEPNINDVKLAVDLGGESVDAQTPISQQQIAQANTQFEKYAATHGILCPGSGGAAAVPAIAQSMMGKITYDQSPRNVLGPEDSWKLDCSFFVHTVYKCAGLPSPGTGTGLIFPGTEPVNSSTFNSIKSTLKPGDLLGWTPEEDRRGNGHVVMYLGAGKIIEVQAGGKKGTWYPPKKAVLIRSVDALSNRIRHVKRIQ